jgi:asparagine synthase (glutamine-hydrolysing)
MGGLCGWISQSGSATENKQLIERMAKPILQFDEHSSQTVIGRKSALAIVAQHGCNHTFQQDGVLVGLWGRVQFLDQKRNQIVHAENVAKALLQSWLEIGESAFVNLEGEFSLCIIDENQHKVVLAVDRMASRSLTYQVLGENIIFASTADAINQHPLIKPEIDPQSLYNYVYFHMIPSPDSVYKNQRRLLPGEYLVFQKGNVETKKYWQASFNEKGGRSFNELKDEFLQLLRSSVRKAAGDEPVGAFLSGGTDSSTIAGILSEVSGKPAKTYSIGFEAVGYDEMEYARIAAQHFSTQHHEYYVTPDDVVAAIPQIAAIFDQPFGNASAIPAFYCARMAKADGLSKLLGGDGGDELFGGNERYAKQYLFSLYEILPPVLRKRIFEPFSLSVANHIKFPLIRKARSYIEQASVPMPARMETYNLLSRNGSEEVFHPEFLATINPNYPNDLIDHCYHQAHAESLVNNMIAFDWKFTLADNDLPKVVKACELAQMEVAFPLISNEMIAFSEQLEPKYKLNGTKLRYFFKKALQDFLPKEIILKQKHGFGLPFGVWLQDHKPLRDLAADSLNDLKQRKIINADFIDKLLNQRLKEHAGYHGTMVWVLMMLEHWHGNRL